MSFSSSSFSSSSLSSSPCHRHLVSRGLLVIILSSSSSCHSPHVVIIVILYSSSFPFMIFVLLPLLRAEEPEKKHGGGDWFSLHYWTDATAIYSNWSISHQFIKPCLGWLMQKKTKTKTKTKTTVVEHVFIYSSITDRGSQLVWALFIFSSPNDDIQ